MSRHPGLILAISGLVLVMTVTSYGGPAPEPRPTLTPTALRKPVKVTQVPEEEGPLISEPSDFTIVLMGRITDKRTGEPIENATTVIVTVTGSHLFQKTPTWTVMFPAKSVAEIVVEAPGYKSVRKELKAHYDRNVTFEIEIKLEPEAGATSAVFLAVVLGALVIALGGFAGLWLLRRR